MRHHAAASSGATDCVIGVCVGCIGIFCAECTGGIRALRNMQIRNVITAMDSDGNFTRISIARLIGHRVFNGVRFRFTLRKVLSGFVIKRIGVSPIRLHIKVPVLTISIDDSDYVTRFALRVNITCRNNICIFSNGICGVRRSDVLIHRYRQSI